MSIEEYLDKHLDEEYKPYPDHRTYISNGFHPFRYKGEVYCVGFIRVDNTDYNFIVDNARDGCIKKGLIPVKAIYYEVRHRKEFMSVLDRANALFQYIITTAEYSNIKTELVLLRILVNQIHKLTFMPLKERNEWEVWIKELYWNRKRVINKWYIDCVLPF